MTRPSRRHRLYRTALACLMLAATVFTAASFRIAQAGPSPQAPGSPGSPNGLVINEVFESQTKALDYFELYNTSAVAINLSTYTIYNHDNITPTLLSRLDDTNIAPGQFRAIGPTQLHQTTIAGSGLARGADFLALVNSSPTDQVIDVVNYGTPDISWPNYDRFSPYFFPPGTQPNLPEDGPKSLQRWPDGVDTNSGSDFQLIAKSPASPSCGDPYEDDNTFSTAFPVSSPSTTLHRICPAADTDFVQLSMSPSYTYTIQANAVGSRVDTALRVYDVNNIQIAQDDPSPSRNSQIVFQPSAVGTYRIQVSDHNNAGGTSGNGVDYLYNLVITQQAVIIPTATPAVSVTPTPIICEDVYEPDNSRQDADNFSRILDLNTEQVHTLCRNQGTQTDEDWVKFAASGGKIYTMLTKDLTGPTDTVISLYDSEGNKLAENDDYQPGTSLASRIDYTFGSTSIYYLRIRDKRGSSGRGYQYTVSLSSTGQLPATGTPTVTPTINPATATPTQPPCGDVYEPDGVPETAKLLLIGQTQPRHSICPAGDADWVRFYGVAGKVYVVRTANLGVGLDTYMYLFDGNTSEVIAQNDDGGDGVASRIDFYPQHDGFYFVQIKNKGDLGLPEMTYDLSLAVQPGVPQPPGTATSIIAPVVTVTSGPIPPTAQPTAQPTKAPAFTPTQGAPQPTPASVSSKVPAPVPTGNAEISPTKPPLPTATTETRPTTPPQPPTQPVMQATTQPTTQPPASQPTNAPQPPTPTAIPTPASEASPTTQLPGVPHTGFKDNKPNAIKVQPAGNGQGGPIIDASTGAVGAVGAAVQAPSKNVAYAPMLFRVFYDRDHNDAYSKGEGIRGVSVYFHNESGDFVPTGSLMTSLTGDGKLSIPISPQRIYIPYFGLDIPLSKFPERELHSLWLPPVQLPSRVP